MTSKRRYPATHIETWTLDENGFPTGGPEQHEADRETGDRIEPEHGDPDYGSNDHDR